MSKLAIDYLFKNTPTTAAYPASYNQDAIGLGEWIGKSSGANPQDNYCGPQATVLRPMEAPTAIAVANPHVVPWSSNEYQVYAVENSTAAATRRLIMSTYNKTTGAWAWNGFITITFPTATVGFVARGLRMVLDRYTTGTVAVAATAVTGTGSTWVTERLAVGARIGFGSTNPSAITTWYQITAIGSETGITIGASAGTIAAGTPYVIEDYTALIATTNTTATNGGLQMVRGLNPGIFIPAGTSIAAAVSTDKLRACYWLKDAATLTNTAMDGVALGPKISATEQYVYCVDGASTSAKIFKYNFRAPLTVATGASVNAWVLTTGAQVVTGNISATNNGRLATLGHGPGSGVECLYFVTASRVYRVPTASILSGSTTFIADSMTEVPYGGTSTFAASAALSSLEVMDNLDRLLIMGGVGGKSYVTTYRTDGGQFEYNFLVNDYQIDQSAADASTVPHPNIGATVLSAWSEGGMLFLCRNGTAATTNQMYALANKSDYYYSGATNDYLVSPRIATPNAKKLSKLYTTNLSVVGGERLGSPPEPYKVFVRTAGISDDSGSWGSPISADGDISGVAPGSHIQVAFSFRSFGWMCVPARILGFGVTYEDTSSLSNYQFSATLSIAASKQFAWRFSTAFGTAVPTLQVQLYDAQTGGLLLTDSTVAPTGTWEKSTNSGGAWSAYNTTDLANTTTYIRYTPASLADNIVVRPVLTLA
jgi:hypothetical protein